MTKEMCVIFLNKNLNSPIAGKLGQSDGAMKPNRCPYNNGINTDIEV